MEKKPSESVKSDDAVKDYDLILKKSHTHEGKKHRKGTKLKEFKPDIDSVAYMKKHSIV